jgi:hypothetical protein
MLERGEALSLSFEINAATRYATLGRVGARTRTHD